MMPHARTKIVATIGPASSKPEVLAALIAQGVDVARINFSHGTHEQHARTITTIRGLALDAGKPVAILGDFSQYLIYDRIGTTVEFVQNTFNSSALPTGQRALIAHKRVGGDVTDLNAFVFLKA